MKHIQLFYKDEKRMGQFIFVNGIKDGKNVITGRQVNLGEFITAAVIVTDDHSKLWTVIGKDKKIAHQYMLELEPDLVECLSDTVIYRILIVIIKRFKLTGSPLPKIRKELLKTLISGFCPEALEDSAFVEL
jgi:hypothetical protein